MLHRRYTAGLFSLEIVVVAATILFVFPLYLLAVDAFKSPTELYVNPIGLPQQLELGNFARAFSEGHFASAFLSSAIIMVASLIILVFAGSLAAYAISRRVNKFTNSLYLLLLIGIILPFQLAMIPLFQLMLKLGLIGSYWSLILFYAGQQMPFTIFLYAGFVRAVPLEFEEAARVDGANLLQNFFLVVFPMLRPVTVTILVLNGVFIWNDFLTPLLYLAGSDRQTVPVAIYSFVGQYGADWGLIFASLLMASLPLLAIYFFLQRYLIAGFSGGIKG